jgi:hypothetical protein
MLPEMKCVICGRLFQTIARTAVCCGITVSVAVGQPTRPQPIQWQPPVKQAMFEIGSSSTASATVQAMGFSTGSTLRSTGGSS